MPREVHNAFAYSPSKCIRSTALGTPRFRTAQCSWIIAVVDPNYQRLKARKGLRGKSFWDTIGMKFSSEEIFC
eukprot:8887549-Pyramimonas_sp.AAC.1